MAKNPKQYPAAKQQWEARTGAKVIGVRLDAGYRARLERLARRYGGNRQVVEAGIDALERADGR